MLRIYVEQYQLIKRKKSKNFIYNNITNLICINVIMLCLTLMRFLLDDTLCFKKSR